MPNRPPRFTKRYQSNNPHSYKQYNDYKDFKADHDDRNDQPRRVSFKPSRFDNKQARNKNWEQSIRAFAEDEDIDMGGPSNVTNPVRFPIYKRGGKRGSWQRNGSPAPSQPGGRRKLFEGPTNFYKVVLPYGNKYDKDYILKALQNAIVPLPLIPISWRATGNMASFFLDDFKTAEKLYAADRTIQCPDGFKMLIKVSNGLPQVDVNPQLKEKMKLAMAKRYEPNLKALDLTKFHVDPMLGDHFCALFKPVLMIAVFDIIAENIPEIEALNLADNRIQILDHFKDLKKKLVNLKILHLGSNKLRQITSLDALRGLPIEDLVLDGNPLCNNYTDRNTYVSDVRKRLPKVRKLDGTDLPPPIGFDLDEEIPIPKAQQTFLCSQDGQDTVRRFLEQYFLIYDSDSRQPLLQAYHEHAMFSMTMAYPYGMSSKNSAWLNWYQTDNRNLHRVQDPERRNRLLRQGHLAVVSFLQEMPKTKHDVYSFTVDLSLFTPQLLMLSVTGIFKELESGKKSAPMRSFSRVLVIVPAGSGFCIINEQLHITNATESQIKGAFKTQIPAAIIAAPAVPAAVALPTPSTEIDDVTKQQMVQTLSHHSGMNLEYTTKCLQETNWDFQRALYIFSELQKQGTIPAEAFVKVE